MLSFGDWQRRRAAVVFGTFDLALQNLSAKRLANRFFFCVIDDMDLGGERCKDRAVIRGSNVRDVVGSLMELCPRNSGAVRSLQLLL